MTTPLERFARTARQAVESGHYDLEGPPAAGPSLAESIADSGGIVAEIKPAAPDRGRLRDDVDPAAIARGYADAGARGVSVLTEPTAFEGSVEALRAASEAPVPTLLKDFVVHPVQIEAAARAGAGAVLLILDLHEHARLGVHAAVDLAHELDLDALLEVYDEEGLEAALATDADVVGVNNRDLRDPDLPLDTTLAPRLLGGRDLDRPAMALSGMEGPQDVRKQVAAGADAVLVGTALMTADDPADELRRWIASS